VILGLTGSLGSGKSSVTSALKQLGAVTISADDVARDVISPGQLAHSEIVQQFGPGVLSGDGSIDRKALASLVFADPEKRKRLEAIIHPRVREEEERFIALHRDAPLVVLEIPLLFEAGAESLCDAVLVVAVNERERVARLKASRGMSEEEIARRLAAQMPQEEKIRRADYVIDNSGTWEQTLQSVKSLYRELLAS
jgi:dephospho-CoA kinase